MSTNSGPGYSKNPQHLIDTGPAGARIRITFNGEVIADTRDAIKLEESGYAPVFYIPRKDVKMECLTRTEHHSYCPYKGKASYFTLSASGKTQQNAIWSYEQPYDEVGVIRELLAFYPNKVNSIEAIPS
jgi:uncharacterized protein (DUF427 family)